jgi:hypothetical protein
MKTPAIWSKLRRPRPALISEDVIQVQRPTPGETSIDMIARPLIVGRDQDPIAYAKFRLEQIAAHIAHQGENLPARFWNEARTETYSLLHAMRVHGEMTAEEEMGHLAKVLSWKKQGDD